MCGAHAQVLSAAELSIGRRILGATRADVRRAVWDDRTLCKTFGPRGTVHLLLPQTCRCGRAPFRHCRRRYRCIPSRSASPPSSPRRSSRRSATRSRTRADGRRADGCDRRACRSVGRRADDGRLPGQVASVAAAHEHRGASRGALLRANRGNKVTYTDPHRWLPGLQPDDGDIALRELVRRYLFAYGPAMPQHFAKWLNIPPSRADSLFRRDGRRTGTGRPGRRTRLGRRR